MEKKEVIAELLKNGGVQVKALKVKNVTVTNCETYTRIALTLNKPVKGMITKDDGITYEEGETNVIFVSLYSIVALLKDNDDAGFAVNHFISHPSSMSVILSCATINIIQESVEEGQEYRNPWSENAETTVFDHKTYINHVTDITLSEFSKQKLDKLADKLLGI